MKRLLLIPTLLIALALPACSTQDFARFMSGATSTITNPVSATDIYRVKNAYAAALELAVKYREYCWSKPYAALMADPIAKPTCQNRREAVRTMQGAQVNAAKAIAFAEDFVRNNPTLNAVTAINAAWSAVTSFQNTMPSALKS